MYKTVKEKNSYNFTWFRFPPILIDLIGTSDNAHRLHLEEISEKLLFPSSGKEERVITQGRKKKFFLLPGKIKCMLYKCYVTESKYGNQNILSPTTFKGETFKIKNYILIKNISF